MITKIFCCYRRVVFFWAVSNKYEFTMIKKNTITDIMDNKKFIIVYMIYNNTRNTKLLLRRVKYY